MRKGWIKKRLRDVTAKIGSGATPLGGENAYKQSGTPLFRSLNVHDTGFRTKDLAYLDEAQAARLDNVVVESGDVLLNITGASIARCCVAPDELLPARVNQHVAILRPCKDQLLPSLLHYMLISRDYKNQLLSAGEDGGSTRQALTKAQLQEFWLEFPEALPEQRRIVGILDEAFAGIATAKANAEKNLRNARELFESHLNAVFTQRGEGWVETTLGEQIDLLAGFAFKSAQYTNRDQDVRLLRGDNIIQGRLRWNDVKKWPAKDAEAYKSYELRVGDVVLAMDRPWVKAGLKHATITTDDVPCLLVQRTARLRGLAKLSNRFLMYLIGSAAFIRHILGVQTGIGVPHISGQQIKDFEFALPSVVEQRRIADNLEVLREETQHLESVYRRKLDVLDELKKSLLHQAFSGQL